jgi:hypothetical protein
MAPLQQGQICSSSDFISVPITKYKKKSRKGIQVESLFDKHSQTILRLG